MLGPVGLAPIVGSNLGCWFLMAGLAIISIGIETRGKSIDQIDEGLLRVLPPVERERTSWTR
ncbi:hypothetical protein BH10PSE6_BH10PSE6_31760 [soil metagenome]